MEGRCGWVCVEQWYVFGLIVYVARLRHLWHAIESLRCGSSLASNAACSLALMKPVKRFDLDYCLSLSAVLLPERSRGRPRWYLSFDMHPRVPRALFSELIVIVDEVRAEDRCVLRRCESMSAVSASVLARSALASTFTRTQ